MEEQIKLLNQQLLQRDETINVMKVRTKYYVQRINEDHTAALRKLEAALSAASEVRSSLHYSNSVGSGIFIALIRLSTIGKCGKCSNPYSQGR